MVSVAAVVDESNLRVRALGFRVRETELDPCHCELRKPPASLGELPDHLLGRVIPLLRAVLLANSGVSGISLAVVQFRGIRAPALHRSHCETSARWQEVPYLVDGLLIVVDDVDAHCKRATEHGARILTGVESTEHEKGIAPRTQRATAGCSLNGEPSLNRSVGPI